MTDTVTLGTQPIEMPVATSRPDAMSLYDQAQLQAVIDRLEAAHRAATALVGRVGEDSHSTTREIVELRVAVGQAVAAVMSFQPRRREP
jgi:hypothetical protein